MAIEDAVILAHTLKNSDSLSGALGADERSRVAKTARIVETSRRLGKIAQLQNPAAARLRNALLRMTRASIALKQLRKGAAITLDDPPS